MTLRSGPYQTATLASPSQASSHHAVIIGVSIAGLLAARVLRDHFASVTVVDRDDLPDTRLQDAGQHDRDHSHQTFVTQM